MAWRRFAVLGPTEGLANETLRPFALLRPTLTRTLEVTIYFLHWILQMWPNNGPWGLVLHTATVFINPTPTLMAFTGVTNAHGPSPQLTACSLTTSIGSNQAYGKVQTHFDLLHCLIISFWSPGSGWRHEAKIEQGSSSFGDDGKGRWQAYSEGRGTGCQGQDLYLLSILSSDVYKATFWHKRIDFWWPVRIAHTSPRQNIFLTKNVRTYQWSKLMISRPALISTLVQRKWLRFLLRGFY